MTLSAKGLIGPALVTIVVWIGEAGGCGWWSLLPLAGYAIGYADRWPLVRHRDRSDEE